MPADVVPQKEWPVIQAGENAIHCAIVVVITHGQPAGDVSLLKHGSGRLLHVLEYAGSIVSQQQWRLFVSYVGARFLNYRIYMSIDDHQVQISVIVVVEESDAPSVKKMRGTRQARLARLFL